MPPSPLSLLWPTMLIPRKLYFSVRLRNHNNVKTRWTLGKKNESEIWGSWGAWGEYRPMFRVTVMMFRDIVESVTLLKEEAWSRKWQHYTTDTDVTKIFNLFAQSKSCAHTLSRRGGRCFLRRRCRLRSLEAVLCSVALLNLFNKRWKVKREKYLINL